MPMTALTFEVPNSKVSFVTRLMKELGMSVYRTETRQEPQALFDPETGQYLNRETMKAIEEAEAGIGLEQYETVDDFMKMAEAI